MQARCNIQLPSLDAWIMCNISSTMSIYNNKKADNSPFVLHRCSMYSDCSNRTWNAWLLKTWSWVDFCKSSASLPMCSSALLICVAEILPMLHAWMPHKKGCESARPCCSCDVAALMQIPAPQLWLPTRYTDLWVPHLETSFRWLRWGYVMCVTCQGEGRLVCTDKSSLIWFQALCTRYTSEFEAVHYAKRPVEDLIDCRHACCWGVYPVGKYYIALDDTFRIMNLDVKTGPVTELLPF